MHRQLTIAHVAMFFVVLIRLATTDDVPSQIVQLAMLISIFAVAALQRLGQLDVARFLTPGCLYIYLLYNTFTGYGLHSHGISGLIAMLLLAALFGGTGSIIIYCLLSVIGAIGVFYAEQTGVIQTPLGPSTVVDLIEVLVLLTVPSIFLWMVIRGREADQDILIESTERLRLLADNARDFIWTADLNLNYSYCSPSCRRLTGYAPEELASLSPLDLTTEEEADRYQKTFENELERERRGDSRGITMKSKLLRKDGVLRWVETSFGFIYGEDGSQIGVVGATRDITERIELEEKQAETFSQLRQAQRMESIGQLAGGIAHDFNNLLLAIHGYGELIRYSDKKEEINDYVQELLSASERASSLTKQLLMFSRQQAMQVQNIDLLELVKNMMTLVSRLVPASINLRIVSEASDFPVSADVSQIEQVIMNLCVNSRDAIEEGGEIEINLVTEHLEKHGNLPKGDYVRLDIKDDGVGISEPVLERIFDPFFTTKPVGEGTGLGMSVVHGIIKEHGGWVDVRSKVGEGTVVSIWLPKRSEATADQQVEAPMDSSVGDGQTILVVDDDAQVRSVVARLLNKAGYNIIEASNGREGLEAYRLHKEIIRLVVSDIVMPEMSGREFAEKLKQDAIDVPIVFMSGYRGEESDFSDDYPFVAKPFSANDLLRLVEANVASV